MNDRERVGRQLLAGLADYLHEGKYPPECFQLLNALTAEIRSRDFEAAPVNGTGAIVIDMKKFLAVRQ